MELYQLKYFSYAAKYENLSMAAQDLHVSQPSISKAIKALERELSVELMTKNGKYCRLTNEGRQFQQRIDPILLELRGTVRDVSSRGGRHKLITLNLLSANLLMPEAVRLFREEQPDVYFNLTERRESTNWNICVRSTLPQVLFSNALKLMDERIMIAVKKESRIAEKDILSLSDIEDKPFIQLRENGSIRSICDKVFEDNNFTPRVAFQTDTHYVARRMVEEGLGIAAWPEYSWRSHIDDGNVADGVVLKPVDLPGFSRSLYAIHQKDVKVTDEATQFVDFLVRYFSVVPKLDDSNIKPGKE